VPVQGRLEPPGSFLVAGRLSVPHRDLCTPYGRPGELAAVPDVQGRTGPSPAAGLFHGVATVSGDAVQVRRQAVARRTRERVSLADAGLEFNVLVSHRVVNLDDEGWAALVLNVADGSAEPARGAGRRRSFTVARPEPGTGQGDQAGADGRVHDHGLGESPGEEGAVWT
jgi:hypothetical protein